MQYFALRIIGSKKTLTGKLDSNLNSSKILVVTDLDTTFLDDEKIHAEFWSVHRKVVKKGILFSVTSGRQLITLDETFAPVAHNTHFIAENGTYVKFRGRDLHTNPLDKRATKRFIKIAHKNR